MNGRNTMRTLVLISLLSLLVLPGALAQGESPDLYKGLVGIEVEMIPLTSTNVELGQDVEFEVKIKNSNSDERELWLWFDVRLEDVPHEKMVRMPYLSKDAPFYGTLPPFDEVVIRLSARALEEEQIGFYTFIAKVAPRVIRHDRPWVNPRDSFSGHILGGAVGSQADAASGEGWIITSMRPVNEAAKAFLKGNGGSWPKAAKLIQNYPNPFNPSTSISFEVNQTGSAAVPVKLVVYDVQGRVVRTLYEGRKATGLYAVKWDGRDDRGVNVHSGIYLFRLQSGDEVSVRKGILMK